MAQIMSTGLEGKRYFYDSVDIALDASGNGTSVITFPTGFTSIPEVFLVPHLADSATLTSPLLTSSGFTYTVVGSDVVSQTVKFLFIAHEKM